MSGQGRRGSEEVSVFLYTVQDSVFKIQPQAVEFAIPSNF